MLGQAIGDLLPLALGIAISPIPIIAVILMLFSQRARANSSMFLLGWIVGVLGGTIVLLIIANTQDLSQSNGQPDDSVSTIKLVLGLLLICSPRTGSGGTARRRVRRPTLPKYLQAIDTLTPLKALGLGVVLSVVNPKNLMMIIAGALVISQADLSDGDTIIAVLVFVRDRGLDGRRARHPLQRDGRARAADPRHDAHVARAEQLDRHGGAAARDRRSC